MLQKTNDRVLICLPDGRWLALSADLFREALRSGAELAAPSGASAAPQSPSALATADEIGEATHMSRATVYELAKAGVLPCGLEPPMPKYFVGTRSHPDLQASRNALEEAFRCGKLSDDDFDEQRELLQRWQLAVETRHERGKITFHSLRHSTATAAIASGANVQTVSRFWGTRIRRSP